MVMMANRVPDMADFDKEVIRVRSRAKDFFSYYFEQYVFPFKIEVPVPILGMHTLSLQEKREIQRFLVESIDTAEPLQLLVLARKAEMIFKRAR